MEKWYSLIALIFTILSVLLIWPEIKKYIPFMPKPLLRISYQVQNNNYTVIFENIGTAPANYFTADIRAKNNTFRVGEIHSNFALSTSGKGGNWTTVSGRDILPQQKGSIHLIANGRELNLKAPIIKSDSKHVFVGELKIIIGPEEINPSIK